MTARRSAVRSRQLPDPAPWPSAPSVDEAPSEMFRVGFWESVWTAPLIHVSEDPPPSMRLLSRVRVGSLHQVITPGVQRDPRSRPLTPRELVRALGSGYFAAIVIPRELSLEHADRLIECAQVAIASDGVRVAVCMSREDAVADGFDGTLASQATASWCRAAWGRVRRAAAASPVRVCFPFDVGAVDTARQVRDVLGCRVELRGVAPERWPAFFNGAGAAVAPGGCPVIAVAPEPLLDSWRRAVWESNLGLTTAPVDWREDRPDLPPTVSVLSLLLDRERCETWLAKPTLPEFLGEVERQAKEIIRGSPSVLATIARRLQLETSVVIRECASCDFTTRFAPSWVARLGRDSAGRAIEPARAPVALSSPERWT